MGKKRTRTLLVVLVMVTMVLTACSSTKSARETLEEALLNEMDINTSQFKLSFYLNMDASSIQDPQFAVFASMLNNVTMTIKGMSDVDGEKISADISLNFGGMGFNGELYYFEDKAALKLPFLSQILGDQSFMENYIVIDTNTFMEGLSPHQQQVEYDEEEVLEVYRKLIANGLDALSDKAIIDKGQQDITIDGTRSKAREIEIIIDEAEIKTLVKNIFAMLEDPSFREMVFDIVATMDPYVTQEVFDEEIDTMLEELEDVDMDEIFREMGEVVDMDNFYIKSNFYVDDASHIVKHDSEVVVGLRDGNEFINITAKAQGETWDINQSLDMDMPDIHEDNSIDIFDFMMRMMFNPYFY